MTGVLFRLFMLRSREPSLNGKPEPFVLQWTHQSRKINMSEKLDKFLTDHLRLWKDEGVPAPLNELKSIEVWLSCLGHHGVEETKNRMRARMLMLGKAAYALNDQGPEAEDEAGIYDNRPDMKAKRDEALKDEQ
jgi:hypothetical protein